jgi:hypothetical protein
VAAAGRLCDPEPVGDGLLDERHERYEAHRTVLADKVLQSLEDLFERAATIAVRIKTAEALVDEDVVEADIAAGAFDDIGQTEG